MFIFHKFKKKPTKFISFSQVKLKILLHNVWFQMTAIILGSEK